jgi:hypothetical protein
MKWLEKAVKEALDPVRCEKCGKLIGYTTYTTIVGPQTFTCYSPAPVICNECATEIVRKPVR